MFVFGIEKSIDSWPSYRIAWMVLAVAFLALLPAWLNYDIISRDGAFQYIPTASLFLEGRFFDAITRPQLPLFPFLIAIVSKAAGFDLETSGRLISALGFILTSLGIYKVSGFVFKNRWVALLSVIFLISNRELLERSVDCLKESLLLCFVVWGNYFILEGLSYSNKARYFISGALLLLLGAIVRSTSLFFLGAWLVMWVFYKKQGILARGAILILPAVGVLLLWYINPGLAIFRKSFHLGILFHTLPGFIGILKTGGKLIANLFSTGNPMIILFGGIGLYFWKKGPYPIHLSLVLVIFFIVLLMLGWTSDRYLLAPIVWLYPLASYACVRSVKSINRPIKILAIIAIISCPIMWADKAFAPPDPDRMARKEAGKWILSQIGPDQEVVTNRDRLAFYAHAKFIPLSGSVDIKDAHFCAAIDVMKEDGKVAKENLNTVGVRPDKIFNTIYVYLSGS